ncbi:hydantoinase/oxoprolinase family protein [Streptomyces mexicanus]|jgi:N-methylhydantoinase A|uniref:Hydantoinase/oxoprolinase family protein n=1 Tax=Streptomyces mexicanus TaxID=178566 RepID=A0A7X1HXT0_9ACTN|nr:hydantoinase/oxoprolinase family protein [Streptomyces mexicanus]MBC2864991.1 hydantoinase/oxoprolinase family protein [Streptomyces mexicanus]
MAEEAGIGLDIGGTFTDAVLQWGGATYRAKSPTTPHDLGDGVMAACALLAEQVGRTLEQLLASVTRVTLGTTAVTNVLTSMTGRRVGLLTTAGFEDELGVAKGRRLNIDGWVAPPPPLVARADIRGVHERVDRDGVVLTPLHVDEVVAHARDLVAGGVEAIAVSYLWSQLNPEHERLTEQALAAEFPDLPVMCGGLLNPVMRGYERTTFAVLNAYTGGAFTGVDRVESRMRDLGLTAPLLVVNCAGGAMTMAAARELPLALVHSGPAAGVAASAGCAIEHGAANAVACDMGGTSFDVALVTDGTVNRTVRGEIFGIMTALAHVDVESIGAGGGSVGWIDSRGVLRVGPRSAGSSPGPACYGRGGSEPTITDALVVLGHIDAASFLGGQMQLDRDAAMRVCAGLGAQIGLDASEVAWGIRSIALDSMVRATRMAIARRGLDPRTHSLVSYGGCGSLFTADIAKQLHARQVIVPPTASVFSAYGAVAAPTRRERTISVGRMMPVDAALVAEDAAELVESVRADLEADGIPRQAQHLRLEADLRFRQQTSDLTVPLSSLTVDKECLRVLAEDFEAEYVRRYGRGALLLGAAVELVALRAVGEGEAPMAATHSRPVAAARLEVSASDSRKVRLERQGPAASVPVHRLDDLPVGAHLAGPACIDGRDTTIWVPSNATADLMTDRSLVLTFA